MIHENIKIDIDYEKLGIKHKGADAVFTTYIKKCIRIIRMYLKGRLL